MNYKLYLCKKNIIKKVIVMLVERVEDNRIVLNISASVDFLSVQRLINYAKYLEATAGSVAQSLEIAQLADEVSRNWWAKNKTQFLR